MYRFVRAFLALIGLIYVLVAALSATGVVKMFVYVGFDPIPAACFAGL